jgi:ketosteroid isomerase-like protein
MKKTLTIAAICLFTSSVFAQKNNETTSSLVTADKVFAEKAVSNGFKNAITNFSAADGIIFNPNPTDVKTFETNAVNSKTLSWQPNFARLSKSRDWGFTAGTYQNKGEKPSFGNYIHIWKADDNLWKCVLNISSEGIKPIKGREAAPNIIEQTVTYKSKILTKKGHQTATEIISSTEKILNTMLKTHGVNALAGFLSEDARLMFPGMDMLVGKTDILAFNNRAIDKINLKTSKADKAYGGDFAYTYGLASIDYKTDLRESFNYVFIWERQNDGNWNIIAQIFTLAER